MSILAYKYMNSMLARLQNCFQSKRNHVHPISDAESDPIHVLYNTEDRSEREADRVWYENSSKLRHEFDTSSSQSGSTEGTMFEDGLRRIDMILVYKDDGNPINEDKRQVFEKNLRHSGLQLEKAKSTNEKSKLVFLKIHAVNLALTEWADIHDMKVGFKDIPEGSLEYPNLLGMVSVSQGFRTLRATFREEDIEGKMEKEGEVFTSAERSAIVFNILGKARYGIEQNSVGLPRLLAEKVYTDVYPLHEGQHNIELPPEFTPNDRRLLYLSWSRPWAFSKKQPLDLVNKYFGNEVALYFAWLGCYTAMLVPASIIGIIIMIISVVLQASNFDVISESICNTHSTSAMVMCPRCSLPFCQKQIFILSDSCAQSRLSFVMDNYATIFNAFCMAFWAVAYREVWHRQLRLLQWRWDLHSADIEYDLRPEFLETVKTMRYNPILKKDVPHLSWQSYYLRKSISVLGVSFMVMLSVGSIVYIILYKLTVIGYTRESDMNSVLKKLIVSFSAPVLTVVAMNILGSIFQPLSFILTDLEMPRTQAAYEKSRAFKVFAFSYVNSYTLLVYLAFIKGKFYSTPEDASGQTMSWLYTLGKNQCDYSGCVTELIIQLFVIMIVKQGFANITEVLKPQVNIWLRRWRWLHKNSMYEQTRWIPRWEEEFQLRKVTIFTLSEEVQEMVIQYGFTTQFIAIFPIASLFALLNNIVEIRVDANKWLVQSRRSIARKVENLGAWEGLMQFITYVAVLSNGLLIAFTSETIPETLHHVLHDDLHDYVEEIFAYYPVDKLPTFKQTLHAIKEFENVTYCRYPGLRYPPWHKMPYEFTYLHWHYLSYKLGIVVFFVFTVVTATNIFSWFFPDISWVANMAGSMLVKEQMMFEQEEAIQAKKKLQKENREKEELLKRDRSQDFSDNLPQAHSISNHGRALYTPCSDENLGIPIFSGLTSYLEKQWDNLDHSAPAQSADRVDGANIATPQDQPPSTLITPSNHLAHPSRVRRRITLGGDNSEGDPRPPPNPKDPFLARWV